MIIKWQWSSDWDNVILFGYASKVIRASLDCTIQILGPCTGTQAHIYFQETSLAIEHPVYNFQVSIHSYKVHREDFNYTTAFTLLCRGF